jgi:hypothetical protein
MTGDPDEEVEASSHYIDGGWIVFVRHEGNYSEVPVLRVQSGAVERVDEKS